jgi:DNA replicative helicase MCM subunit Mcm2 (Cdc46/Mcm family)
MAILDETGFEDLMKLQRQLAGEIVNEVEIENKIKVISIIDSLTTSKRRKVQIESILIEAQHQGLSERQIVTLIEELQDDGIIAKSDPGYVQKL